MLLGYYSLELPYRSRTRRECLQLQMSPTRRLLSPTRRALYPVVAKAVVGSRTMGRQAYGGVVSEVDMGAEVEQNRRAITPLPVPRVSDLKQFEGHHRERLYWGTYRPYAYLGIRARTPESLLAGLMWDGVTDGKHALRHYCENSDELTRWSWLRHDGSTYGRQVLVDHGLVVTTHFLKSLEESSGYGGDWAVRVKVEEESKISANSEIKGDGRTQSIFFYVAEEAGKEVHLWPERNSTAVEDDPFASGSADEIGDWQLHAKYKEGVTMNYVGLVQKSMSKLSQRVKQTLGGEQNSTGRLQLPDASVEGSNVAVIQLTGELPLEADFVFVSGVEKESARVHSCLENLTGRALDERLANKELAFEDRFQNIFKLHEKVDGEKEIETGRVALSNMLGGIGYFYGQTRVGIPPAFQDPASKGPDYWLYWPASLYTAVPSRSTFPRGFLWDEGFHQLLISRWDRSIALEIIANWFDLINIDGWIPREVILGEEAISRCPPFYVNQYTDNANPPALMLVLTGLGRSFESDRQIGQVNSDDIDFFKTIFPRLEIWFNWFLTSQTGKERDSYYWHGRDDNTDIECNPKSLTSGLDDYPRASHPTDDERHVDLRCWMAKAADTMALFARLIGAPSDRYEKIERDLTDLTRLNELHYDSETGRYYDYGLHSEKVELRWKDSEDSNTGDQQSILRRVVLEPPQLGWVPHFGLNSLFPFLMRLIPHDSPILGDHLEMLANPDLLWTDFGLRSLATTSSIFMKHNTEFEAPYWRGPVWINLNYLVLAALHDYAQDAGPYSKQAATLYRQFRENVIRNIVQRYHETGYIWETYKNDAQGIGQGAHPFTGWSALIVLIMAEIY